MGLVLIVIQIIMNKSIVRLRVGIFLCYYEIALTVDRKGLCGQSAICSADSHENYWAVLE